MHAGHLLATVFPGVVEGVFRHAQRRLAGGQLDALSRAVAHHVFNAAVHVLRDLPHNMHVQIFVRAGNALESPDGPGADVQPQLPADGVVQRRVDAHAAVLVLAVETALKLIHQQRRLDGQLQFL